MSKVKYYQFSDFPLCPKIHIEGTSLTVPGEAPSLKDIVLNAVQGVPLPQVGTPLFDASDEAGEARVSAQSTPIEDIVSDARNGAFDIQPSKESEKEPTEGSDAPESETNEE